VRGQRYTASSIRAALLDAVAVPQPDTSAWEMLAAIAQEEQGEKAPSHLAATLGQRLSKAKPRQQKEAIDGLGAFLGRRGAVALARALASEAEPAARHLALVLLSQLPQPIDASLEQPLRPLLQDRQLPPRAQRDALAAVLQTLGPDNPLAGELVNAWVSAVPRSRGLERLQRLQERTGPLPLLQTIASQLQEQVRMSCPRCGVELRRPEMIQHLWDEHRLVLDGRRVREPWPLIEEWLDSYKENRSDELLKQSEELARRLDPERGPDKLQRLLAARELTAPEARQQRIDMARSEHAACCPWCFALVPIAKEMPPQELLLRGGRISGGGYVVAVAERGLRTHVDVRTPTEVLFRGSEPEQYWTASGAMLLTSGPLVLLALLWATWGPVPLAAVFVLLTTALAVAVLAQTLWKPSVSAELRARRYSWTLLAPHLHERGFAATDSTFLAGLAAVSVGDGLAALRASTLPTLLKHTELAASRRLGAAGHLALLRRLAVEDAAAAGADPVLLVVDQVSRSFQGRLPLTVAELLLDGWRGPLWTQVNLERLRVLLCDRAFEAGFELSNLVDAGRKAPALGAILRTDNEIGLAALRLLWSLRASRPWDRCGDAQTVFDIAASPEQSQLLQEYPDLLLYQTEANWPTLAPEGGETRPVRILVCLRGLFLQGTLITEAPKMVEMSATGSWQMLILGAHRFYSRGELDTLVLRMERWCRYVFSELLLALPGVLSWRSPNREAILRAWGAQPCPECKRFLLPLLGRVGIPLEEAEVQPQAGGG
jgi:hypothetical protein